MVLNKIIRPALREAGIVGKTIGWHSFRHTLATNLRSRGVDVKVAQELLRHANSDSARIPGHCIPGHCMPLWLVHEGSDQVHLGKGTNGSATRASSHDVWVLG